MSTHRFSIDSEFIWKNHLYRVKQLLPGNRLALESLVNGQTVTANFTELFTDLINGLLTFLSPAEQRPSATPITLADFPANAQAVAQYRLNVIKPLLKIPPHSRTRTHIANRVNAVKLAQAKGKMLQKPVSVTSVYRWLKDYANSNGDIRSLVPKSAKRKNRTQSRLPDAVEAIVKDVIQERYFTRERVKVDDILHEVAMRVEIENRGCAKKDKLEMPSHTTVWRRVDAIDLQGRLIAKKGKRAAKAQLAQFGRMDYPQYPLERVEIDHTITDIFVVDDTDNLPLGRLTLTYCIDVATRYPLGFYLGFEPPSHLTIAACLHHTMLPKPDIQTVYGTAHEWLACGVPNVLVIDNGKEFLSPSLQDACLSLGILLQQTPVKTPHFKATVERMFNTINTGLFHMLPGTTFSNVNAKGDYDSLRWASLRQDELNQLLHLFLVDIYAESFHRGLGGIPARKWEEAISRGFFPRVPTNPEELSILLGRMTERTIQHYGIELFTLRYNCDALSLLRHRLKQNKGAGQSGSARTKIKYLPDDLGHIYVYDPFEMQYIKVPALDQAYANGLSIWSHDLIRAEVLANQDRVSMVALGEAKRKIQQIVEESKQRGRKRKTRKKQGRWQSANSHTPDDPLSSILPDWNRDVLDALDEHDDEEWGLQSID
ncbi:MAG: transposase [Anaerolineales bacterium]|nr:transposase [Anaerolineales bacterium]